MRGLVTVYTGLVFISVNGMWGLWGSYSTCTKSCGIGTQTRSRKCNNPAPAGGGSACSGFSKETSNCNIQPCPSKSNNNEFN